MSRHRRASWMCVVALVCIYATGESGSAQEVVDNPVFKNWNSFPEGAKVTYRSTTTTDGVVNTQEYTLTLKAKTPDKVVIERVLSAVLPDGTRQAFPAMTSDNAKTYKLPKGVAKPDPDKPAGVIEQGEEELDVMGKKISAKWFKAKMRVEAGEMFTRSWSSAEIPGGLIKAVNETPATKSVHEVVLIDMKIPKEG